MWREHSITYRIRGAEHTVFFPSLRHLHERIQMARDLGLGLSIWELGQGLPAFFDLL